MSIEYCHCVCVCVCVCFLSKSESGLKSSCAPCLGGANILIVNIANILMANKVYFTHAGFAERYQDAVMALLVAIGSGGGSDALMVRTTRMLGHDVVVLAEKVSCLCSVRVTISQRCVSMPCHNDGAQRLRPLRALAAAACMDACVHHA